MTLIRSNLLLIAALSLLLAFSGYPAPTQAAEPAAVSGPAPEETATEQIAPEEVAPEETASEEAAPEETATEQIAEESPEAPEPDATAGNPRVRIETTKGVIVVELFVKEAPLSSANFLKLVEENFYNGLVFHRVVANFVVQVGGYDASLAYRAPPATVANESSNGLLNLRGTLAMARQDDPDSADAQFFINMSDNPHLDPVGDRAGYSVFGKVVAGLEAAERIELSDTNIQAGMAGVPEHPIEVISATLLP